MGSVFPSSFHETQAVLDVNCGPTSSWLSKEPDCIGGWAWNRSSAGGGHLNPYEHSVNLKNEFSFDNGPVTDHQTWFEQNWNVLSADGSSRVSSVTGTFQAKDRVILRSGLDGSVIGQARIERWNVPLPNDVTLCFASTAPAPSPVPETASRRIPRRRWSGPPAPSRPWSRWTSVRAAARRAAP